MTKEWYSIAKWLQWRRENLPTGDLSGVSHLEDYQLVPTLKPSTSITPKSISNPHYFSATLQLFHVKQFADTRQASRRNPSIPLSIRVPSGRPAKFFINHLADPAKHSTIRSRRSAPKPT